MYMRRLAVSATICVLSLLGSACNGLDVHDPTVIQDGNLNNATGADLLRRDAIRGLFLGVGYGAIYGGILADEMSSEFSSELLLDRRQSLTYEVTVAANNTPYFRWQQARRDAISALPKLKAYGVMPIRNVYIAQMLFTRGYVSMRMAEDFCPGFPLNDVVDYVAVFSPPMTTEGAFQAAVVDFDSALVYVGADSVRLKNLISVSRGLALVGLGKFSEAAAAVAAVPTNFVYNAEFSPLDANLPNQFAVSSIVRTVADKEGGIGLDYISSGDPRTATIAGGNGFTSGVPVRIPTKFSTTASPIPMGDGIEARLIEAEAALKAGSSTWLTTLNTLRSTAITPALPALADPGTDAARVNLLFRERAFWLFLRGNRLGDMRRLISQYGRTPESVFPTGQYKFGELYGTATSIPFPMASEAPFNPAIKGCTNR
jgi:hypothetical protein